MTSNEAYNIISEYIATNKNLIIVSGTEYNNLFVFEVGSSDNERTYLLSVDKRIGKINSIQITDKLLHQIDHRKQNYLI